MSVMIATIEFDRIDYDREADVLYLSVGDPARASDYDETRDGHALRFDNDGNLVGITIVGARRLADAGHDVHVKAPVTLTARSLASMTE